MTIHLLKYNNYYNRYAKRLDSLEDYREAADILGEYSPIDFNPGDGIVTTQIVNFAPIQAMPDYFLVTEDAEIKSRWFVIGASRTRGGQYLLSLRRDLVADYYEYIMNTPAFIEKGTLPNDGSDPFIFNPEQMTFNQILKSRTPLFDRTGVPWMVIYSDKATQLDVEMNDGGIIPENMFKVFDTEAGMKAYYKKWEKYEEINKDNPIYINYYFRVYESGGILSYGKFVAQENISKDSSGRDVISFSAVPVANGGFDGWNTSSTGVGFFSGIRDNAPWDAVNYGKEPMLQYDNDMYSMPTSGGFTRSLNSLGSTINKWIDEYLAQNAGVDSNFDQLREESYDNERTGECPSYCFVRETGKIYNVRVQSNYTKGQETAFFYTGSSRGNTLDYHPVESVTNYIYSNYEIAGASVQPFTYRDGKTATHFDFARSMNAKVTTKGFNVSFEDITYQYNLIDKIVYKQKQIIKTALDTPYNMICLPYGSLSIKVSTSGSNYTYTSHKETADLFATAVSQKYGNNNGVYDIQIVPYCPLNLDDYYVNNQFTVKNSNLDMTDDIQVYVSGVKGLETVFYAPNSSIKRSLSYSYNISNYKVQALTEFHRLEGPNGNGVFEFNAAMNGGISGFEAIQTLKPGSPYIHVKPLFNKLYGRQFDKEKRGLFCGGDFSIPQVSDQWLQYVVNNKNYQNAFDRQIENMTTNRGIERRMQDAQVLSGTLSAAASGATTGAMVGGGYGAVIGGSVAGIASFAAGQADKKYSEQMYQENLDYTKDMYGMTLENIKARPNSLYAAGGLNADNNFAPVLEFYQATPEEIQALRDKIRYNGMTIGRIGTFAEFLNNTEWRYTKGKVIQLSDGDASFPGSFAVANELGLELSKGLFMTLRGDL